MVRIPPPSLHLLSSFGRFVGCFKETLSHLADRTECFLSTFDDLVLHLQEAAVMEGESVIGLSPNNTETIIGSSFGAKLDLLFTGPSFLSVCLSVSPAIEFLMFHGGTRRFNSRSPTPTLLSPYQQIK